MPITHIKELEVIVLESIPCIYSLVQFQKGNKQVSRASINSDTHVNPMITPDAKQLNLEICQNDVRAEKIEDLFVKMFEIVIAGF